MCKVVLFDHLGFRVGEPEVPSPLPQVVVWGDEAYVLRGPSENESPQYHACSLFVIPETRENPLGGLL